MNRHGFELLVSVFFLSAMHALRDLEEETNDVVLPPIPKTEKLHNLYDVVSDSKMGGSKTTSLHCNPG